MVAGGGRAAWAVRVFVHCPRPFIALTNDGRERVFRLTPWMLRPSYWRDLWTEIKLVWYLFWDGRVSLLTKVIPVVVAAYILFPIDLIPGFIPILGQMDDLAVLMVGIQLFLKLAPSRVVEEYGT